MVGFSNSALIANGARTFIDALDLLNGEALVGRCYWVSLWQAPDTWIIKITVDAAFHKGGISAGLGVIARNSFGSVIFTR